MNSVVLVGRLSADPEVRYSESGNAAGNYALAVDRRYKREGEPSADFIRCVVFGKSAEFAEKYFTKGMRIAIRGRIQTGSYMNKEGRKIYTTDVVVEDQEFAQSKAEGGTARPDAAPKEPAPQYGAPDADGFMQVPDNIDEELPFV